MAIPFRKVTSVGMLRKTVQPQSFYRRTGADSKWLIGFVLIGIFCQVALLDETLAKLRVFFRCGPMLCSVALLFLPGVRRRHPAQTMATLAMGSLSLSLANPSTYIAPLASIAQCVLYLAIIAPLYWVKRIRLTLHGFVTVVLLLWSFHTLSSFFGVLQTFYPGKYQPAISKAYTADSLDGLRITLADGSIVFRPMGLTDTPGGAAASGYSAILFGLGIILGIQSRVLKVASLISIGIGFYVIYLSMVRVTLVIALISILAAALAFFYRNDWRRAITVLTIAGLAAFAGFAIALIVGGKSVQDRVSTLTESSAGEVYYNNRGYFLASTFTDTLPTYPLGAGPGRWGMMVQYFGKPENAMWVEIQWTGWILDGGFPFMLAYCAAVIVATWSAWRLVTVSGNGSLAVWAVIVFARDISTIAQTFSYPVFCSQSGMEFWMLNACVFVVAIDCKRESRKPRKKEIDVLT